MMSIKIRVHPIPDDSQRAPPPDIHEEDEIVVTSDMVFEGGTAVSHLAWLNCPFSAAHEIYIAMERARRAQMNRENRPEQGR